MDKKQIDILVEKARKAKPLKKSLLVVKLTEEKKYLLLKAKENGLSVRDTAVLWEKAFAQKVSPVTISRYLRYLRNT